jgi:hypothetical protein
MDVEQHYFSKAQFPSPFLTLPHLVCAANQVRESQKRGWKSQMGWLLFRDRTNLPAKLFPSGAERFSIFNKLVNNNN